MNAIRRYISSLAENGSKLVRVRHGILRTRSWILGTLCSAIVAFFPCHASAFQALAASHNETFDNAHPTNASDPIFQHGYLIQRRIGEISQSQPNIFLLTTGSKHETREISFWPAGSERLSLTAVSIGVRNVIAVAGTNHAQAGNSYFIAMLDFNGKVLASFDTGQFSATALCQVSDGSIWAMGSSHLTKPDPSTGVIQLPNYDTLRHFSVGGQLLDHLLPRWDRDVQYVEVRSVNGHKTFTAHSANGGAPDRNYSTVDIGVATNEESQNHGVHMEAESDNIEILDPRHSAVYRWQSSSHELQTWKIAQLFDEKSVTGMAILPSGRIFASRYGLGGDVTAHVQTKTVGLYELVLAENATARWQPINEDTRTAPDSPRKLLILGGDGEQIVFVRETRVPFIISWMKPDQ